LRYLSDGKIPAKLIFFLAKERANVTESMNVVQNNDDQEEYWNSPAGQKWIDHQAEMDNLLSTVKDRLLKKANLQPGEHVLDIGCGTGATTLEIARQVGQGGSVIGADISDLLLSFAETRVTGPMISRRAVSMRLPPALVSCFSMTT
jgi:cyclopropane fatty-acyl-phospholipid synthase-like methyltransferase